MSGTRSFRCGLLLCVLAVVAAFAANAFAGEYNLKMRPEIGRCVKVAAHGEFRGAKCTASQAGANHSWLSGPGAKPKFTAVIKEGLKVTAIGLASETITCSRPGEAEGEYTGPKNFTIKKLVLQGCRSGLEGECQNKVGSAAGEITFEELDGELGYISHPKKLKVGWDIHPKSGANLAVFECGAEIVSEKSLGNGASREIQGSVIGKIEPLDRMQTTLTLVDEVKNGLQVATKFEGGPRDTLTLVKGEKLPGMAKTPYAATLSARTVFKGEEALEVLGKCNGAGC
jgi:hypothetical protein